MKNCGMKSFLFLLNLKGHFATAYNLQMQLYHHGEHSHIAFKVACKYVEIILNVCLKNILFDLYFRDRQSH